jgi:hypothetical protein
LGGGHSQENLGEKFMPNETTCEIHIRDVLDEKWSSYFAPFTLTIGTDETILTGVVHDQAELFGVLLKIRDSGLTLVSLMPVPSQ